MTSARRFSDAAAPARGSNVMASTARQERKISKSRCILPRIFSGLEPRPLHCGWRLPPL